MSRWHVGVIVAFAVTALFYVLKSL